MLRDGDVIELLVSHQQWRDCSIHNQIKHTPQQGFPRFKLTKKGSREAREYISARAVLEGTTPALDTRMHTHHACAHGLSTNRTYKIHTQHRRYIPLAKMDPADWLSCGHGTHFPVRVHTVA